MTESKYTFDSLNLSSQIIRDLINKKKSIKPLITDFFSKDSIISKANSKSFSKANRELLHQVLNSQNKKIKLFEKSKTNIEKILSDNTFTITTGHQLNLSTGPLYTIYKILEVINWTEEMNESDSDRMYVPVFWMATEDHDFEEINHTNIYNNKIDWQHTGIENSVVGRIELDGIQNYYDKVLEMFGDEKLKNTVTKFLNVYRSEKNLASANRVLINELFGEYGLLIIDGDDVRLKRKFVDCLTNELNSQFLFSNIQETNKVLDEKGYHQQVFVRPINLFYIKPNGKRVRIEQQNEFFIADELNWTIEEILKEVNEHPERFSPNALFRPVYQEIVLPNLVYVGGGGEIAYWLQLKSTFNHLKLDFPILKVRDSVILIKEKDMDGLVKFNYSIKDLKVNTDDLIKEFVLNTNLEKISLTDEKEELRLLSEKIQSKALSIDNNMSRYIDSEFYKILNQFEKIEKKFMQVEKKKQEKTLNEIKKLQHRFFPNGGFQERHENILNYIMYEDFISEIKSSLKKGMTEESAIHLLSVA